MNWISVKEKVPDKQDLYLCCGRTIDCNMGKIPDIIFTAYYYLPCIVFKNARWVERTRSCEDVTIEYWMPLPEMPNE